MVFCSRLTVCVVERLCNRPAAQGLGLLARVIRLSVTSLAILAGPLVVSLSNH